jgi:hypothetical protein
MLRLVMFGVLAHEVSPTRNYRVWKCLDRLLVVGLAASNHRLLSSGADRSTTRNVVPAPSWELTSIVPPLALTTSLQV